MKKNELTQRHHTMWRTLAAVTVMFVVGLAFASVRNRLGNTTFSRISVDTTQVQSRFRDLPQTFRMSTSLYPVMIKNQGRAVMIQSDHAQFLPIYMRNGTFYMMLRLTKGVNWLSGLPRGHYFINNRPVTVN